MTEPPITPEVYAWIQHYIKVLDSRYASLQQQQWPKNSYFLERDYHLANDYCNGTLQEISDTITDLSFALYLVDNPLHGDVGNKNEWE